jgi:hypothetical protein
MICNNEVKHTWVSKSLGLGFSKLNPNPNPKPFDPRGDLGSSRSQARAKMTLITSYLAKIPQIFPVLLQKDASLLELYVGMLSVRNGGQTSILC